MTNQVDSLWWEQLSPDLTVCQFEDGALLIVRVKGGGHDALILSPQEIRTMLYYIDADHVLIGEICQLDPTCDCPVTWFRIHEDGIYLGSGSDCIRLSQVETDSILNYVRERSPFDLEL